MVLDRILDWMKTHSGHNEYPVLQESVSLLPTGERQVVSECTQIGLALRVTSQQFQEVGSGIIWGTADSKVIDQNHEIHYGKEL